MLRPQHGPRAARATVRCHGVAEGRPGPPGRHGPGGHGPRNVRDLPKVPGTPPTARRRAAGTASPSFPLQARGRRREAASAWAWAVRPPRTAGGRSRVARAQTAAAHTVVQGDGGATGPDEGDVEKETRGRGNARHSRAPAFKRAGGRATPPHHPRRPGEAAPPGPAWRKGCTAVTAAPPLRHPERRGKAAPAGDIAEERAPGCVRRASIPSSREAGRGCPCGGQDGGGAAPPPCRLRRRGGQSPLGPTRRIWDRRGVLVPWLLLLLMLWTRGVDEQQRRPPPQTKRDETAGQDTSGQGHGTVKRPWTRRLRGAVAANKAVGGGRPRPKAATGLLPWTTPWDGGGGHRCGRGGRSAAGAAAADVAAGRQGRGRGRRCGRGGTHLHIHNEIASCYFYLVHC